MPVNVDLKRQSATIVVNTDTLIKAVCRSSKVTDCPKPGRDERKSYKRHSTGKLKWINNEEESDSHSSQSSSDHVSMFTLQNSTSSPITTDVLINGKKVIMEVDTGAAISIIGGRKLLKASAVSKSESSEVRYFTQDIHLQTNRSHWRNRSGSPI